MGPGTNQVQRRALEVIAQAQVVDYPVTTLVNAALELAWRSDGPAALDAALDRVRAAQRRPSSAL